MPQTIESRAPTTLPQAPIQTVVRRSPDYAPKDRVHQTPPCTSRRLPALRSQAPRLKSLDQLRRTKGAAGSRFRAQRFHHDIEPAHALGVRRIWVNRRAEPGNLVFGPYGEIADLSPLPDLLGMA